MGLRRAVKIIDKKKLLEEGDDNFLDFTNRSIEILAELDHPHIYKFYEIIEEVNKLYIVTELL